MKESVLTVTLAACCFVMMGVIGINYFMVDREAPVISLDGKNTLKYTEGADYDILLEGVTAKDNNDGDVTESLRVTDIYVTAEGRAVVTYVAKDNSNNIGKLKREVIYQSKLEAEEAKAVEKIDTKAVTATTVTDGPKVTMIQNEATLKVGETFNVFRYIQSAVDIDGTNLSRNLHVEGTYDMNRQGVYLLNIYAINSEGEISNREEFTLIVVP